MKKKQRAFVVVVFVLYDDLIKFVFLFCLWSHWAAIVWHKFWINEKIYRIGRKCYLARIGKMFASTFLSERKKRSARSHVNYISLDQHSKTELFLNKWKVLHAIFINYRKFFKIKLWKMHGNSHFIKFHDLISFCFHFFFLDFINFWFCQSNLVWFCLHFNN